MQKEIYILRGLPDENYKTFRNRVLRLSEAILDQYDPESLKTCLTLKRPPRISVIPFKKNKIAVISIIRKKRPQMELIIKEAGYAGGYSVEEAIPVDYSKTWQDGEPTPGECLLTLFHKKKNLDQSTFIRRWHEGHTPLSLKLHPLWNYNRNMVKSVLSENSAWYDGIVEEQFQNSSDLLNPFVFFGPPYKVPVHMYQVFMDTRSFIDMRRIETYLATEIHFKS